MRIEPRLDAIRHASRRANGTFSKNWSPLTTEEKRVRRLESHRGWLARNKDHIAAYNNARRKEKGLLPAVPRIKKTREQQVAARRKYLLENKDKIRAKDLEWRAKNKEHLMQYRRKRSATEKHKARRRELRSDEESKEKRTAYLNRPEVRARNRVLACAVRKRYLENLDNRLTNHLRTSINRALRRGYVKTSWRTRIDYTVAELRAHLEKQFNGKMSWENHGLRGWHIDHIVPVSHFGSDIRGAWALTNLRPLWAKENLTKNKRRIFLV